MNETRTPRESRRVSAAEREQRKTARKKASERRILFAKVMLVILSCTLVFSSAGLAFGIMNRQSVSLSPLLYAAFPSLEDIAYPLGDKDEIIVEPTVVEEVDTGIARIYLTFDDGPSTVSTPRILDILAEYGIHATFFELGSSADANPDIVRQVHAAGHAIGNHSYSHNYGSVYASTQAFFDEIDDCDYALTAILGEQPAHILRFPGGSTISNLENNPALRESIKAQLDARGWRYFDWNVSFGDSRTEAPAPGELAQNLNANIDSMVAAGVTDIVVLGHDVNYKPWTPADLPIVIEHCLSRGYVFRTLSADNPPCQFR